MHRPVGVIRCTRDVSIMGASDLYGSGCQKFRAAPSRVLARTGLAFGSLLSGHHY